MKNIISQYQHLRKFFGFFLSEIENRLLDLWKNAFLSSFGLNYICIFNFSSNHVSNDFDYQSLTNEKWFQNALDTLIMILKMHVLELSLFYLVSVGYQLFLKKIKFGIPTKPDLLNPNLESEFMENFFFKIKIFPQS